MSNNGINVYVVSLLYMGYIKVMSLNFKERQLDWEFPDE